MGTILIENAFLITLDSRKRVYEKGSIVIEGNRIIDVDSSEHIKQKNYRPDLVIDGTRKAVLPGLVNTHTHFFQILLKCMGDDLNLDEWLDNVIRPCRRNITPEELYYASATSCIESIRSGVTTTCEMQYLTNTATMTGEAFRACQDVGVRAAISYNPIETDRTKRHWTDNAFVEDIHTSISRADDLYKKWHGKANGRLHAWCGPCATWSISDEGIRLYTEWAAERGTKVTMHVCETQRRLDDFRRITGKTPTEHIYSVSPNMGDKLVAVHAVAMTDQDLDILAKHGASVSHNTTSNAYLGDGIARVPEMLRRGINVALGLDGPASNCSQNMWELLKMTALIHKANNLDSTIMTAEDVLEMAISGGAKALGLEAEIGSLEPGKKADIILIDLQGINYNPLNRVASQLVYCGQASDVCTVIIDGNIVYDQGKMTTIDETVIKRKTQEATDNLVKRTGMEEIRKLPWKVTSR